MEAPPILNQPPILVPPPAVRRRWWVHLLLIAGYIIVVGLRGWERKPAHGPALLHSSAGLLYVCGREVVIFGVVLGLACWASRPTLDDLRLRWRGFLKPLWLGLGYSAGLRLAVGLVVLLVAAMLIAGGVVSFGSLQKYLGANRPDVEALVDVSALRNNPVYFWLTVTVASFVVAGLREELWRSAFLAGMRGLWPRYFGTRAGQLAAVLISAILFGSAHLVMGVPAAILAGLLGVGLGCIMVFHRSIWPAVIAHGFFDATTFALLPWLLAQVK